MDKTMQDAQNPATNATGNVKKMMIGNLLALSAAICWGLNEPANKVLIPDWISASGVALSRIFGAAIVVWLISLFVKNDKIQRGDWKLIAWSALMMVGFIYVFSLALSWPWAVRCW